MKIFRTLAALLLLLVWGCEPHSKGKLYDAEAIDLLDSMSQIIGDLESCSFTLEANSNQINDLNKTVNGRLSNIYLKAPDKMFTYTVSENGRKGFWYNGEQLAIFRYDDHQFDTEAVSGNILEMMDAAHKKYNYEFPAADIFYPTFTDDLMSNYDTIVMLETPEGEGFISILGKSKSEFMILNLDENSGLPTKLELVNRNDNSIYYEGNFSHWKVNPNLPDRLFKFSIPENAEHKNLIKK